MLADTRFRARLALEAMRYRVFGVAVACPHSFDNADRESPHRTLPFEVGGRAALLCYGSPSTRGRTIFGDLVPWDELWRTGANEPTTLTLSFPAVVAGISVPRGRYALYTLPRRNGWQLVVNRSTRQSGRTREEMGKRGNVFPSAYTPAVARAEAGRTSIETRVVGHVESLTASVHPAVEGESLLLIEWETTQLLIPIRRRDA